MLPPHEPGGTGKDLPVPEHRLEAGLQAQDGYQGCSQCCRPYSSYRKKGIEAPQAEDSRGHD